MTTMTMYECCASGLAMGTLSTLRDLQKVPQTIQSRSPRTDTATTISSPNKRIFRNFRDKLTTASLRDKRHRALLFSNNERSQVEHKLETACSVEHVEHVSLASRGTDVGRKPFQEVGYRRGSTVKYRMQPHDAQGLVPVACKIFSPRDRMG
jgi:hypothetical protein